MTVDLKQKRKFIAEFGLEIFDYLTGLSQDIRVDNEERTGIQIFGKVAGTKNVVTVAVRDPSEETRVFAIEQAVRTECFMHKTSQDSEDIKHNQLAGSVSMYFKNQDIHLSVCGLKPEENVALAIILLAKILEVSINEVIYDIQQDGGKLPDEILQEDHYLKVLLDKYR
ncbi:MAG: hypothetical protein WCL02_08500 [bacterium]